MADKSVAQSTASVAHEEIRLLIIALESDNDTTRIDARTRLAESGSAAVDALQTCLYDPRQHVRWEAAKTLQSIADPSAASALVTALDDEDPDVRWVAGQALIGLGDAALPTLLRGLIRHSDSVGFRRAAHHVLHDLNQASKNDLLAEVIRALDSAEPGVASPPAAWAALRSLTIDRS